MIAHDAITLTDAIAAAKNAVEPLINGFGSWAAGHRSTGRLLPPRTNSA